MTVSCITTPMNGVSLVKLFEPNSKGFPMRSILLILALTLSLAAVQPAEAGPLRRAAYRISHPFAPIGSYSGPKLGDGTWKARLNGNGGCRSCR